MPLLRQVQGNGRRDHALSGLDALERTAKRPEEPGQAAGDDQLPVRAPAPTPAPEPRAGALGARVRKPEDGDRPLSACDREPAHAVRHAYALAAGLERIAVAADERSVKERIRAGRRVYDAPAIRGSQRALDVRAHRQGAGP